LLPARKCTEIEALEDSIACRGESSATRQDSTSSPRALCARLADSSSCPREWHATLEGLPLVARKVVAQSCGKCARLELKGEKELGQRAVFEPCPLYYTHLAAPAGAGREADRGSLGSEGVFCVASGVFIVGTFQEIKRLQRMTRSMHIALYFYTPFQVSASRCSRKVAALKGVTGKGIASTSVWAVLNVENLPVSEVCTERMYNPSVHTHAQRTLLSKAGSSLWVVRRWAWRPSSYPCSLSRSTRR